MNLRKLLYCIAFLLMVGTIGYAQEVLEWRGVDRRGIYQESNLLKSWPAEGPKLLWEYPNLGNGYGSPVITASTIFVNGEIDTISYLFALDATGKFLWKSKIGHEWTLSYPGARTTPTVVGDLVYATAGYGTVACFEAKTGKEKWSVDMIKDFHGRIPRFGFSESVLVEGENVYCSPGSADTNTVALNRFTGKITWICKGVGEETSYCSPLLIKLPKRNILVTFSKSTLLGIDTKDGKLLWSHKQAGEGDVQVNTPLFENGFIYYIAGNGNGAVKLKLSEDGAEITEVWKNIACDNLTGAFIKIDNYIYTSGYEIRNWKTLDASTGQIVDSLKFDRGTINLADGMLYLYNEKGQLGLCKPNGPKMDLVSSFKLTKGTKAHYAHPVINKGIFYVRHGNSLLAYDIKAK
jgi:outer membrane protein assembly factor BamB